MSRYKIEYPYKTSTVSEFKEYLLQNGDDLKWDGGYKVVLDLLDNILKSETFESVQVNVEGANTMEYTAILIKTNEKLHFITHHPDAVEGIYYPVERKK